MSVPIIIARATSPIGVMVLAAREADLVALDFEDCESRLMHGLRRRYPESAPRSGRIPRRLRGPIEDYFDGRLDALEEVSIALRGTEFQRRVWAALRRVSVGETVTYTELARRAGAPRAIRAAGHANALNPISLVVPCHRVVGVSGSLTGYAGGLARKRWLLEHEGALPSR